MIVQAVFAIALLIRSAHAQEKVVFNTLSGPVRGERTTVHRKSIDILLSIPFAKPPTGSLRFKPPQPVEPWTTTLNATKTSPVCLQLNPDIRINKGIYDLKSRGIFTFTLSEDCLYLNIWKPSNANRDSKLPVMLYIHGGSFNKGMKDVTLYEGQHLTATNDVIVVTINYRVGLMGFGYLGRDTLPGNLGLLDQLEAMKWVQKNIEYFGGDPKKITIFGENAGSWSVGLHLISPLSAAYFDKAIMQGGSPLNKILSSVVYPHNISRQNVKNFSRAVGCSTITDRDIYTCLMHASSDTLQKGLDEVTLKGVDFYPVVDGYFLPEPPLDLIEKGRYKKTNVLMGVTKHEYTFPSFLIINPNDKTLYQTGKKISSYSLESLFGSLPLTNGWNDKQKVAALKVFYESSNSNREYKLEDVLMDIGSDLVFVCPVHLHASLASKESNVYFYVYNYKMSSGIGPHWVSLTHRFNGEPTFGVELRRNFHDKDTEVSRMIMTYWTNFAKTGNPNSPVTVTTNWPTFNYTDQFYLEVCPNSSIVTRQGPRRLECAFINEILPNVKDEWTTPKPCEWPQRPTNKGFNVRLDITGVLAAAAIVIMMLQ